MPRKDRRTRAPLWWGISILLIALLAILATYFFRMHNDRKELEGTLTHEKIQAEKRAPSPQLSRPELAASGGDVVSQEIAPLKVESDEAYCSRIDKEVRDFFAYLNSKEYVRHIEERADSFDHFLRILAKLSSKLPVPAGESADSTALNSNIYHLFRVLDRRDIRLIREIMVNESQTLEINLDMFYRWLTLRNRCPDSDGIRPPQDVLYHYAGFFLNTIGGRSYLFRRPPRLRLLGTYYSLLIIHESDKEGKNLYGIDPFPHITALVKEINLYPDFRFHENYLKKLETIEKYYLQRR